MISLLDACAQGTIAALNAVGIHLDANLQYPSDSSVEDIHDMLVQICAEESEIIFALGQLSDSLALLEVGRYGQEINREREREGGRERKSKQKISKQTHKHTRKAKCAYRPGLFHDRRPPVLLPSSCFFFFN